MADPGAEPDTGQGTNLGGGGIHRGRSTSGHVLSRAWTDFKAAFEAASPRVQQQMVGGLFGSLVLLILLSAGMAGGLASMIGEGPLPGDLWFAARVEQLVGIRAAVWLSAFGSSAMLVPIVATATVLAACAGRAGRALGILMAFLGSKAIGKVGWVVWERPRPGEVLDGALIPDAPSFPSGHVIQAVAIYGLLAVWWGRSSDRSWERGTAWILPTAVVVGTVVSRVRMGAHWASDCWAAILLGGLWVACILWAETGFNRELSPRWHP